MVYLVGVQRDKWQRPFGYDLIKIERVLEKKRGAPTQPRHPQFSVNPLPRRRWTGNYLVIVDTNSSFQCDKRVEG